MPKEFSRTDRVADLIQRELALLIQRELKMKDMGMVTVSFVHVSKDLSHAKVYITVLGEEEQVIASVKKLNESAAYLRGLLARTVKLRITPELRFIYDDSLRNANKISALIDAAIKKDEKGKNS